MSDSVTPLGLDALAASPSLAAGLPEGERCRLLGQCAAILAALSASPVSAQARARPAELPTDDDPLIDAAEVARMTGFALSYVYEMGRRGDLPTVRHKRYVRFRMSAVKEWIARHEYLGPSLTPSAVASRSSRQTPERGREARA